LRAGRKVKVRLLLGIEEDEVLGRDRAHAAASGRARGGRKVSTGLPLTRRWRLRRRGS